MTPNKLYVIDLAERVVAAFVITYLGAVVVLPGGFFSSHNWQVALAGAVGSTVKGLLAGGMKSGASASLAPGVALKAVERSVASDVTVVTTDALKAAESATAPPGGQSGTTPTGPTPSSN